MREFVKSANIWRSYKQESWLSSSRSLSCWKMNSPETSSMAWNSSC